jgi:hypothetical protein
VSWIGRVRLTPDSRIERIDIDPVTFESGTADFTAEGHAQSVRLTAFLSQLPAVRLTLTPVVSSRDSVAPRRRALEAELARANPGDGAAAPARLFAQRFPGRPVPGSTEAIMAALLESQPESAPDDAELAARRIDAVRNLVKQAGLDADRLVETRPVVGAGGEGRVELAVREPEAPRRSPARELLRRLGVPTGRTSRGKP